MFRRRSELWRAASPWRRRLETARRATKEGKVDERSRVLVATCLGAVAGGVWGCRVRDQIEPKLDDLMHELTRERGTVEKARGVASEGWRSLNDVAGSAPQGRWSA